MRHDVSPQMRRIRRSVSLLTAVLTVLGLCLAARPAYAATPTVFANVGQQIIGVAATPGKLLVTTYGCSTNQVQILSLDGSGNVSNFGAPLPPVVGPCSEDYIAVSPGLGGFPLLDVYVTQGKTIFQLSPDGSSISTFATIGGLAGDHNGITFDHVGSFGNQMILTGANGNIFTLSSGGVATFLVNIPDDLTEGSSVAATGVYAGDLIVPGEKTGNVYAVTPGGQVSVIAHFNSPEAVLGIPTTTPCTFNKSGGSVFNSFFAQNQVTMLTPADLGPYAGDLLVTNEWTGEIDAIDGAGNTTVVTPGVAQGNVPQFEGSALVDCQSVPNCATSNTAIWNPHVVNGQLQVNEQASNGFDHNTYFLLNNATVANDPPAPFGFTGVITVAFNKINSGSSSQIGFQEFDTYGCASNKFDPVMTSSARQAGKPVTDTYTGILQSESAIQIANGTPGVDNLKIDVNGKSFNVSGLADGAKQTISIASALNAGSNTVSVTSAGKPGGTAGLLIGPPPGK